MSDSSLNIQRYNSGLMTPAEAAAFEHAVEKSPELQAEFDKVGDTLLSMYRRFSEGMPAPDAEIKDILLSKITEDSRKRGAALIATGGSILLTPDVLSDSAHSTEGRIRSLANSKTFIPFFLAAIIGVFSVIAVSNSNEPVLPTAVTNASKAIENPIAGSTATTAATYKEVTHSGKDRIIFQKNDGPVQVPESNFQTDIPENSGNIITSVNKEHQGQEASVPVQKESSSSEIGTEISHGLNEPHNREYVQESTFMDKFSLSIQHFSTLKFYPGRLDMAPRPTVNNW